MVTNNGAGILLSLFGISRNGTIGGTVNFVLPVGPQTSANGVTTTTPNATFAGGTSPASIMSGWETVAGTTWAVSSNSASSSSPTNITGLAAYNPGFAPATNVDAVPDAANGGPATPNAMTVNSLRFNHPGQYTVNPGGNITIASGGILITSGVGSNSVAFGAVGTTNTLSSGNGTDLIVFQNNTAGTATINSVISGRIAVSTAGAGTLILGNPNNTYTTGTYIGGGFANDGTPLLGVVQVPADTATGNSTPTIDYLGHRASAPNNIFLNGGVLQFTESTAIATTRGILLGGLGGAIDTMGNTVTYGGVITDSSATGGAVGNFTKLGSGTLILSGVNSYFGVTVLDAGTLSFTARRFR